VATKARFGKATYNANTSLTLHRFDLGGKEGDTLFAQQFGIPLSVALALVKDLQDNIALDIALETDEQGTPKGVVQIPVVVVP